VVSLANQPGRTAALSILFVAIENIVVAKLNPWRIVVVFGFGLLHGLGFAGVSDFSLGLPRNMFVESLVAFNVARSWARFR
jgi:hypothetical protein